MSYPMKRRGLLAVAIAASFVAGCGTQQLGAPTGASAPAYQSLAAKSDRKEGKKHHKGLKFLEGLDLTDDQKERLETIKKEFEPGVDHDDFRAWMSRAKTLLTAETVDEEALGKLADQVHSEMGTLRSKTLDMLVAVRNVLTTEQRQEVADKLNKKADKKHDRKDKKKMLEGLGLTDEQKAALKPEKKNRADKHKAMATFFVDGDREALEAALTPDDLDAKVDRMVETLAGLDLETRKKLVERLEKAHEKKADRKRDKPAGDDKAADADVDDEDEAADDEDDDEDEDEEDEDEDDDNEA